MHRSIRAFTAMLALAGASCANDPAASSGSSYGMGGAANLGTYGAGTPPPAMSPARKVNEQDCSRPVDIGAGNLRCK